MLKTREIARALVQERKAKSFKDPGMGYLVFTEVVTRKMEVPISFPIDGAAEFLDCISAPHESSEAVSREVQKVIAIQDHQGNIVAEANQ